MILPYLILTLVFAINYVNCSNQCFTGGVYEHKQLGKATDTPEEEINSNLLAYEYVAKLAASHGVQVLVFPEDGIFTDKGSRDEGRRYLENIPNPKNEISIPCDETNKYKDTSILYRLSCMAKKYKMFIAANMGDIQYCNKKEDVNCPKDSAYQYNTEVLFDSNGKLIVKYHKYHLFYEYMYDVPRNQSFASVDTIYGKMGLFICFDLIFKEPGVSLIEKEGIDTVLYPTWWFEEKPFLSAHQYNQGWAIRHNVNFLSANINNLSSGSLGSGIYSRIDGFSVYTHQSNQSGSKLLISRLPIKAGQKCSDPKTEIITTNTSKVIEYKWIQVKLSEFNKVNLQDANKSLEVCDNTFCCNLSYKLDNPSQLYKNSYYLIARNRTREGAFQWAEEMCGLIKYDPVTKKYSYDNGLKFSEFKLSANFSTTYVYPSVMSKNMSLVRKSGWDFINSGPYSSINLKTFQIDILSVTLYGRAYQRDPQYSRKSL